MFKLKSAYLVGFLLAISIVASSLPSALQPLAAQAENNIPLPPQLTNGGNNAPIAMDDAGRMFAVSPFQATRFEINPLTYALIDDTNSYTMPGFTITGINSLAIHPTTGEIYAIIKLSGVSGRVLGTIDLETGVATMIGNLGANFSNLAFTNGGVLYGVTGDGATPSETLFTIDPVTAVPTLVMALGNGADGETIAFNPDDGLMYHSSGNGTAIWESINLDTLTVNPIVASLGTGEIFSIRYIGNNTFLTTDINSSANLITTAGVVTPIGSGLADDYRGMVYDGSTSYQATEDTPLVVTITDNHLLINDFDADFDPLTAVLDTVTTGAIVDLDSSGIFTYTPPLDFCGLDTFTYFVNDGQVSSPPADAYIEVACLPDAPLANDDVYTTTEDIPLVISAPGVLANDYDPDGPAVFTPTLLIPPAVGALQLNTDGSFSYTPTLNFNGITTFTYQISTTTAPPNTDNATVTLHISSVNDLPIAAGEAYTTTEDTPLVISALGVLANDSDPVENSPLTAVLDSATTNGSLSLNSDGSFIYTPTLNFNGTDWFIYQADDGEDLSNIVTVTLTILADNDAPLAAVDAYTTTEDIPLIVSSLNGVLSNDSDVDNDPLMAVLATDVTTGTLALQSNGAFTYTPPTNWFGMATFTYQADDGEALSDVVTVTLTALSENDAPTAEAGANQTAVEGELLTFAGSYSDPGRLHSGGTSIAWAFGDGATATGTLTPSHTFADNGLYTVTLTITDSEGAADSDTLLVTVSNADPTLEPLDNLTITIGTEISFTTGYADAGVLDTHTAEVNWDDGNSEAATVANFLVSGSHTYATTGVYTVTVTLMDDDGGEATQSFVVTVMEVPASGWRIFLPLVQRGNN